MTFTLAMVRCSDGEWRLALADTYVNVPVWRFPTGGLRNQSDSESRPVAVIDPEDREQVEGIFRLMLRVLPTVAPTHRDYADAMQAAVRKFANPKPPKPDEPTGLGAVVVDSSGLRWVLVFNRGACLWRSSGPGDEQNWLDIDAVKVLSPGVTA